MSHSNTKGRQLEDAVRLIEESSFRDDPSLKATPPDIKIREIFTINGVRHEVDVVVRFLLGTNYETLHIFECKNWKDPVGKNEVIVLAEKVKATGAARGYLVGHKFTSDAEAQAATDARIRLISCTSDFVSPLDDIQFLATSSDFHTLTVSIRERGKPAKEPPDELQNQGLVCFLENHMISFTAYVVAEAQKALDEELAKNPTWKALVGSHSRRVIRHILYEPGEMQIGDKKIEFLAFDALFVVHIQPMVTSKIEVDGRGRVHYHDLYAAAGSPAIRIEIVSRVPKK
jgi:hypothetical protein